VSTRWTASERLLLRAAIGPADDAPAAYAQWRDTVDLDTLEPGGVRMLPLLTARAEALGDAEAMDRIGKVVRFAWLRTQMLISAVLPGVEALIRAGLPVVLVKGAAVVAHSGGAWQLRPMDDLDVAVPREGAVRAARALLAAGLTAPGLPADPGTSRLFEQVHALDFRAAPGAELDLHWQVIHGSLHPTASGEFFDRAVPAPLRDMNLRALAREDTLLEVLVHGARPSDKRSLQWAGDAALLLQGRPDGSPLDWELLARTAVRHRVQAVVGAALAELRTVAPQHVPAALPAALAEPATGRSGGAGERGNWREFVARRTPPGERPSLGAVAEFARELVGVERARELPARLATLAPAGRRAATPAPPHPPLAPGGPSIEFAASSPGRALLGGGWWASDAHGTWSRGRSAEVFVPLPAEGAPHELRLTIVPFLVQEATELTVGVRVDGRPAGRWRFAGLAMREQHRHLVLPAAARRDPAGVWVTFAIARRTAPASVSNIADTRPVGFALRRVELLTV
jgi:hypothetical protein